jgi:hypothetical protein
MYAQESCILVGGHLANFVRGGDFLARAELIPGNNHPRVHFLLYSRAAAPYSTHSRRSRYILSKPVLKLFRAAARGVPNGSRIRVF